MRGGSAAGARIKRDGLDFNIQGGRLFISLLAFDEHGEELEAISKPLRHHHEAMS